MLYGVVIKDETNRFEPEFRVITSTIQSQNNLEFITKSGSCYLIDDELVYFDLIFAEFVVMKHRLHSLREIVEMRQALKLQDDRTIH